MARRSVAEITVQDLQRAPGPIRRPLNGIPRQGTRDRAHGDQAGKPGPFLGEEQNLFDTQVFARAERRLAEENGDAQEQAKVGGGEQGDRQAQIDARKVAAADLGLRRRMRPKLENKLNLYSLIVIRI
ncbi:hypothetical protein CNY89_00205 [Amaricoccus sp. HAR-UPW-R2A-40]|nr:hypothetical protein CNY89_00205 [Amaricoccus sp. HAR-UPW-R2A-40]